MYIITYFLPYTQKQTDTTMFAAITASAAQSYPRHRITKIEELKAIADAGEHMPQKSTYFLPKMLSGLVIYKM